MMDFTFELSEVRLLNEALMTWIATQEVGTIELPLGDDDRLGLAFTLRALFTTMALKHGHII